ncbi:MAG: hypothetical protein M1839_000048 [Geoglossum umbratile]|nr:MAG: hypothetical protein M1839_000048 [Geoglossum umbratile]
MFANTKLLFLTTLLTLASTIAAVPVTANLESREPGTPPPRPTMPNTSQVCGKWHVVQPNDENACAKALASTNISLDAFRKMNPSVDANCSNLWGNYAYCVAEPGQYFELFPPRR